MYFGGRKSIEVHFGSKIIPAGRWVQETKKRRRKRRGSRRGEEEGGKRGRKGVEGKRNNLMAY